MNARLPSTAARRAFGIEVPSNPRCTLRRRISFTDTPTRLALPQPTPFTSAEAQAFVDGNKRTAIAAALTFLELNGIDAKAATNALYDAMIGIAEKRLDKATLADRFRALFRRALDQK